MSGVMSLFFCGIVMAHYNFYNMSEQSRISSSYVFESLAHFAEMTVFTYMGVSLFVTSVKWEFSFMLLGIIFCVIGRFCNIFPLSWLVNIRRRIPISKKMQFVIFFAGLRGAVAYALSMQLTPESEKEEDKISVEVVQTTTLTIVIFTTFFLGGTTSKILDRLGMKNHSEGGDEARSARVGAGESDTHQEQRRSGGMHGLWRRIDNAYANHTWGQKVHPLHPLRAPPAG